jgi:hypothetical protein
LGHSEGILRLIEETEIFLVTSGKSLCLHGYFGWKVAFFDFVKLMLKKRVKEA